jgi:hypothetical protein
MIIFIKVPVLKAGTSRARPLVVRTFFLLLGWWLLTSGDLVLIPEELRRE